MPSAASSARVVSTQLVVGLEVHVELATRTKMFSRVPNIAHPDNAAAAPNSLIDPVTLGLPGALPVMNRAAVEMSIMVGMALGCSIAPVSRWDRKAYYYPDMPKNYQISQYPLPLCFDGVVELPPIRDGKIDFEAMADAQVGRGAGETLPGKRIGIIRAHLEEDAGKLLHEAPGGGTIDYSIVDLNRAGTPLLEIVTQPDFESADEVVVFCQMLRNVCRFVGASEGVMQRGHMRFEPNINCVLTLEDGRLVKTPIVEVKNLNSFKAVRAAIEFEEREQPRRWQQDGREMGPGAKSTRGWDDGRGQTVLQREKEDAHDYRYFPDPDLVPVEVSEEWRERVRGRIPELPLARTRRYMREFGLSVKEAASLTDERDVCLFYEEIVEEAASRGIERGRAGKAAANFVLQNAAKRANERSNAERTALASELGIAAKQVAGIVVMREDGRLTSTAADELFGVLCAREDGSRPAGVPAGADAEVIATQRGMLTVRDDAQMDKWCRQAIEENARSAEDVKAGKTAAVGRLVGAVMKLSGGTADARAVRERVLGMLGVGE